MANFALDTFNAIRNDDPVLNARLPAATLNNLATLKAVINSSPEIYNKVVEAFVVRIGRLYINTASFLNPLAKFEKGLNPQGHLVQDVYIEPIAAESDYDMTGVANGGPLARRTHDNVNVAYYQQNYTPMYVETVDRVNLMNAFADWDALNRFWSAKMQALYTGVAIDRYNAERQAIAQAINDTTKPIPSAYIGTFNAKDDASGRAFAQAVKIILNKLIFPHTYNREGLTAVNKKSDFVLLLNPSIEPNIDVYTLASLFNPNYAESDVFDYVTTVDTFASANGNNGDVLGLLTTREFFKFFETMRTVRPIENPQGIFTNFFVHPWGTIDTSSFETAVVLRSGTGT